MISILLTAYKEPKTIGKAIECIANTKYSGIPQEFQLIQISPDEETLAEGLKKAKELQIQKNFIQIKDPCKGKPYALNMALKQAKGDILILTDGDVYFGEKAVKYLLDTINSDDKIGGVTGRPISLNSRDNLMGYISHLLTDAAHHKRLNTKIFFPMSGYIICARKLFNLPNEMLSDDAYISYDIANKGYRVVYEPKATVFVKFPTNLKDYFLQKVRSMGGHQQLKRSGVMNKYGETRSFFAEMKYALFALTYPKSLKEFFYSLLLFPIRLYTWILIFIRRVVKKEGMGKNGWERIVSTK